MELMALTGFLLYRWGWEIRKQESGGEAEVGSEPRGSVVENQTLSFESRTSREVRYDLFHRAR